VVFSVCGGTTASVILKLGELSHGTSRTAREPRGEEAQKGPGEPKRRTQEVGRHGNCGGEIYGETLDGFAS
jgi:hypothetical protein